MERASYMGYEEGDVLDQRFPPSEGDVLWQQQHGIAA